LLLFVPPYLARFEALTTGSLPISSAATEDDGMNSSLSARNLLET